MSQRASQGFGFFQIFAILERIGISACFQPPIRSGTLRLSDTSPARSSGSKGSAIIPAFKSSGRFCAFARLDLFKGRSPAVLSSILGGFVEVVRVLRDFLATRSVQASKYFALRAVPMCSSSHRPSSTPLPASTLALKPRTATIPFSFHQGASSPFHLCTTTCMLVAASRASPSHAPGTSIA